MGLFFSAWASANAREVQSLVVIHDLVDTYVRNTLEVAGIQQADVSVSKLDSRLRLTNCDSKLIPYLGNKVMPVGRFTVGIKCEMPKPWSINVPVDVSVYKTVLATARPLTRNHIVSAEDIVPIVIKTSTNNVFYFDKPADIIGKVLTRPLAGNKAITPQFIKAQKLVRRGENVMIVATTASIQVSMKGKAMSDGAKGELIEVQNIKTKRVIQGIVARAGVVEIRM